LVIAAYARLFQFRTGKDTLGPVRTRGEFRPS